MTAQTKQEDIKQRILDIIWDHHNCLDDLCEFEPIYDDDGVKIGTRCQLRREFEEELINLFNSEVLSALEEVEKEARTYTNVTKDVLAGYDSRSVHTAIPLESLKSIKDRYKL